MADVIHKLCLNAHHTYQCALTPERPARGILSPKDNLLPYGSGLLPSVAVNLTYAHSIRDTIMPVDHHHADHILVIVIPHICIKWYMLNCLTMRVDIHK